MLGWFIGFTAVGCVVLYLTQANQNWLQQPLAKLYWRWLAVLLILSGLLIAISYLPTNSAIFSWLLLIILIIGLLPFVPLIYWKKTEEIKHE